LKRLKFKLKKGKGGVNRFTDDKGIKHYPGDVVDLPASYKGKPWLEPLKEEPKPVATPSKVEAAPETEPEVPLESQKKSKKTK
jgi:hypothetical protein